MRTSIQGKAIRNNKNTSTFELAPITRAVALTFVVGGMIGTGNVYAAQPFSAGWYAAKGALQETARTTGMVNGKPVSTLTNPAVQQQQANAQLQQSIANLGLAARGIALQQASQAMQHANLLKNAPSVPDGLGAGGLDTGSLVAGWINANAPTQTTDANGKIVVGINQTADKAIASWESFNVGKNTIVQFNQASSDWAILNRITDPLAPPSQIQGQIRAPGTVLIVNRNGIVFSGTSQINTRNLVAAAADITDSQFTTGGIYGANQAASFTNADGNLIVEQGAQITTSTPTSATQGGGYVLLMGKQVSNSGDIETPKGQIEMAAGDSFIIRKGVGTDANKASTTRGNEISPQFVTGSTAGQVVNTETGLLLAREGDITLAGHDVQQNGVAVATTNVNTRGTIHLLNSASDTTGSVTLGGKAITTIALDDDGATALDSQRDALIKLSASQDSARAGSSSGVFDNLSKQTDREDQSRIEIVSGGNVQFANGSLTLATGGQIAVSATNRAFAATGSILDVSGAVGVNLAMASNNVVVNVQGNELRDSPDNRDLGGLLNNNITVDRRDLILVKASAADPNDRWYTANGLLEVSGYLNNQMHGIGEWAAQGGTIELGGKEVVAQTGSQLNLSGGTLNVATGYVAQTWLVGSDGNLYNADNAPSNMTFKGVYKGFEVSHPRWGDDASEFFYNPLIAPQQRLENGYTVGRDAGQLIVDAPTAVLEGDIVARVYNGPQQIRGRDAVDGYSQAQTAAAKAGTVSFGQYGAGGLLGLDNTDIQIGDIADVTGGMTVDAALSADRVNTLWLDAGHLSAEGLGELDLGTLGAIKFNAPLTLTNGGVLSMVAPDIDIAANITAVSGSVSGTSILRNVPVSTSNDVSMALESGATIDVRGQWVNGLTDPDNVTGLAWLNGGNVSFDSLGDLKIAAGSAIDVSSGGAVLAGGKTRGGKGGNVTLTAGHVIAGSATNPGNTLTIDGDIRAAGVNGGGVLTLSSAGNVLIGENASLSGGVLAAGTAAPVTLLLAQPLTIPAGQALPMAQSNTFTSLAGGVPAPMVLLLDDTVPRNIVLPVAWTVPSGVIIFDSNNGFYQGGDVIAANTIIAATRGQIAAGTIIDPAAFPDGFPTKPYTVSLAAGSIQSAAVTYAAGSQVPAGAVLPQTVSVVSAPSLKPSFFTAGFSSYDINGGGGLLVANGTTVAPVMPVYRIDADSFGAPTGSDPSAVMTLWLPPLYTENVQAGTLTQRGGASLTLRSQSTVDGTVASGEGIVIGSNVSITVDPGQSIKLDAFRQITVDGALRAHGGSIVLINDADGSVEQARNFDQLSNGRGFSLWLGDDATLDVSGSAYAAVDARGRRYGVATDGGAISLSGANTFVVVRPGAELNADGSSIVIDPVNGSNALAVSGNGGSIAFSSTAGLYLNGDMHAVAGGPGAAGGSLSIALNNPFYPNLPGIAVPATVLVPGVMTVQQAVAASQLPDGLTPDKASSLLALGQTTVSADSIMAGGFGSLSLNADDYMMFAGDVSLAMNQSLTLTAGAFTSGPGVLTRPDPASAPVTGHVQLSAPYLMLSGAQNTIPDNTTTPGIRHPGALSGSPTAAVFEANADQIDIRGEALFSANAGGTLSPGFKTISVTSQGDIRFVADANLKSVPTTMFASDGDIHLSAAQIYPATGVTALVAAGESNPDYAATLSISRISAADVPLPMSVFGTLALSAAIIEQGGIVRAPMGAIALGPRDGVLAQVASQQIDLLPGSITSVSAAGLTIPYGGTIDGVSYSYNGAPVRPGGFGPTFFGDLSTGISMDSSAINVQQGAVLDLSGGGTLAGAGFISGRGGSVNILNTPLINANPATPVSSAGNKVYAIVPGYASGYAPVAPEKGAGDPAMGQQITIPAGVPGLAAGTYTLLPSTYALLPGAYRVEVGKTVTTSAGGATAIGNGTYVTTGNVSVANTGVSSALASTVLVTPGTAVRHYSQFDEQSYSDFMVANAALFGAARTALPADAKTLKLQLDAALPSQTVPSLRFDGVALLQGTDGGFAGNVIVSGTIGSNMEVFADAPTANFSGVSVAARDLNAINAPRLMLGGFAYLGSGQTAAQFSFRSGGDVTINDGVSLSAGEMFLVGSNVNIGNNVALTTIGKGPSSFDAASGYSYTASGNTVLGLSNGDLNFVGSASTAGALTVGAGSSLYAEGTLAFATKGQANIDSTASFGARNIALAAGNVNIGSAADIAAAGVPDGLLFNQALFNTLLHGDPSHGAPALEKITLAAGNAINLFGNASLDATGTGVNLVLNTPAIYGVGAAGDEATIAAGKITWNGVAGATPPAITAGGAGTGLGTFNLKADEIDLGQFVSLDTTSVSRVVYGFNNVNLIAGQKIVAAGNSALYVYQAPGTTAGDVFGQSGTGGNLTLSTPVLTGTQKSIAAYTTGGVLTVNAPEGMSPGTASSTIAGAEIDLNADSINIGSTILLPSGKLQVNAVHDIALGAGSRIDLAGQPSMIQSATVYGFGGTAMFNSEQGGVTQAAGSVIDVSATKANAGTITIGANNGAVALGGMLRGTADAGLVSGGFGVSANTLDFDGINALLTQGGLFDTRSFDIRSGDLVIGDGVKAHNVTVSVDGGSLTVAGTIDASGAAPGSIRLSAMNALTLAPTAVLDAHSTQLQTDSYGQPIEAKNRGNIELAATKGTLTLAAGSTMDVSAADGIARGLITLNASRGTIGGADSETGGDIRIDANGALVIKGAQSIAVNGFWTYKPTDTYGTIVQDNGDAGGATVGADGHLGLNQVDVQSQAFINAALSNTDLQNRLGGLKAFTNAFHLRPGVEIDSLTPNGTLTVAGDIDLSGFRYASLNPNAQKTGIYGSGEPGALVIRAGGDLDIVGSISDGFMPAPATPDDKGWILQTGVQSANVETLLPVVLSSGTTIPNTAGLALRYDISIDGASIKANAVIPVQVVLASDYTIPAGTRLAADVLDGVGNVLYRAGTVLTTATTLSAGSALTAGSVLPGSVSITAMTWQAGKSLGIFTAAVTLNADATVPFEGIVPAGTDVHMANASAPTRPADVNGIQGSLDAVAQMLPQGSLSWSVRLVGGADLEAADARIVKPASVLKSSGVSGNLTLTDSHNGTVKKALYFNYYFADGSPGPFNPYSYSVYGGVLPFWCAFGSCVAAPSPVADAVGGPAPSVVRTGTGNLDLIAGGSFNEQTLFGVYTAGTQSAPVLTPGGDNPFNQPRGLGSDGTLLGSSNTDKAAVVDGVSQAWYPEHGGDVLVSAQNDVSGRILTSNPAAGPYVDSNLTSNWLWRQGGASLATEPAAWWINFGTYAHTNTSAPDASLVAFQGIGTLGGGNLTVIAGRNAGLMNGSGSSGLDLAVGSTGRVLPDGTLVQTGGGDLTLKVGGMLNGVSPDGLANMSPDYFGSITNLRGNTTVNAGAVGSLAAYLGGNTWTSLDPRTLDVSVIKQTIKIAGPVLTPGDGTVSVSARGDLVFGGAGDAGMTLSVDQNGAPYTPTGAATQVAGGAQSSFTLWVPQTAIALYSAGGDVAPLSGVNLPNVVSAQNTSGFYPGSLSVAAANGDIRFAQSVGSAHGTPLIELMPSPVGQLELLAAGSIYGSTQVVEMSGAPMQTLATPFHPLIVTQHDGNNASQQSSYNAVGFQPNSPLVFGPDTPTGNLHAGDNQPARVYAGVDIDDLILGEVKNLFPSVDFNPSPLTWYVGAKPFEVIAGRDIVGTGSTPDVFVNNTPADISVLHAGRDIIYQSMTVAGPGVLDVQTGRNLYQGFYGQLDSAGLLVNVNAANRSGGADIVVATGVGVNGPDYADFAKLYFDAANQLPVGAVLAGSGKVVHSYDQELLAWLQQRFGYTGSSADALAYFLALPTAQQGVFVRQTYYAELTAGGREFNNVASPRFQSYLRGRDAIATLFPTEDAQGKTISYSGGLTMFSSVTGTVAGQPVITDAGIHTDFGGAIQILNPGGQTLIGVEGVAPGAGAGLITQGEGDIDVYSAGSILLGQSRMMTTFGGNILAWSANGDINAGRGSKTTVLFTPPRLVYDEMGNVTLSPQVPSTGAGIATLNPIPEVAAGDVDLIAPLGTIDAGEAGIRVSGNVNLAALQVVNAANIQVQGKSTGLPLIASVNVSALTNASAAATQAAMAAQDVVSRERTAARQALPSIFTVRVLGFGNDPAAGDDAKPTKAGSVGYDTQGAVQVLGQMDLNPQALAKLTPTERRNLGK